MLNIQSVSDITDQIKAKLENEISDIIIRAEISECKFHSSGHIYLVLKDPGAVLPAVIWRRTAQELRTQPVVGMEVIVYGRLSVYAPHGRYQFIIQSLQDAGRGELYIQFEALKARLVEEGLCDSERKKAIPDYPMHVGIVTSETGAALQDMLRIFRQDAPHVQLSLSSARVQGRGAAQTVIDALKELNNTVHPDCVICVRGGGSIEDLWEFNDETLARFIAEYPLPLITGIGHETDTTIADHVSDYRASTPTNAAETVCKSWRDVRNKLNQLDYSLTSRIEYFIEKQYRRFQNIQRYLSSRRMSDTIISWQDKTISLFRQLERIIKNNIKYKRTQYNGIESKLSSQRISNNIISWQDKIPILQRRIERGMNAHIKYKKARYEGIDGKLTAYSPEHVLKKGYSLIRDKNSQLIRSVDVLSPRDNISIEFHDGYADATVSKCDKKG
ncbi:MAG: exodeoxyribonuclease VII large subunit [Candidatus Marinimicrobia bacterium]|nr:exodeoxyribonuclease VII large subunit [Candidatus Neomarinimicrobiota bacterium]